MLGNLFLQLTAPFVRFREKIVMTSLHYGTEDAAESICDGKRG